MEVLLTIFFAALGAMLASFAGVVSERMHTGESWIRGRSHCDSCARTLSWSELIPIFSFILGSGRCRGCRVRLSPRYVLSEFLLAVVFAAAYQTLGLTFSLAWFLISVFFLVVIVLYDLRHTVVPFSLSLLFIGASVLYVLTSSDHDALASAFLTAGIIGLGFFLMHVLSRGRWMGLGDAPVALALSLLVYTNAVSGLMFSFWIGAVVGIVILVAHPKGHRMGIEIPFVPFLAAGYLLAYFTQWHPFLL